MKKFSLLLFVVVLAFQFSFAQWTTSGTNIYNSNSGNVGIGTTSPRGIFDVGADGDVYLASSPNTGTSQSVYLPGHIYIAPYDGSDVSYLQARRKDNSGSTSLQIRTFNSGSLVDAMFINQYGNVGIGTTNPSGALEILKGSTRIQMAANSTGLGDIFRVFGLNGSAFSANSLVPGSGNLITDLGINYSVDGGNGTGTYALIGTKKSPLMRLNAEDGSIALYGESGSGSDFRTPALNLGLYVNSSGNVGIGTSNDHSGYKLSVNGNVLAQKIKITQTGWPDYVFHSSYRLRPLKDLETYIKQNNHLPDVPSASDVEEKGLDLGDNQAALLKKIEELTLYIIEQDKKIESLETQNKELLNIKKDLETIKAKLQN